MISHMHVKGFKCLRDVAVELGLFNVLIGPNDSGKTSLLDAIHLLGQTVTHSVGGVFQGNLTLDNIMSRNAARSGIRWEIQGRADNLTFSYILELSQAAGDFPSHEHLTISGKHPWEIAPDNVGAVIVFTPSMRLNRGGGQTALSMTRGMTPQLVTVANAVTSSIKYRLTPDALRQPSHIENEPILDTTGSNLAAVLQALLTGPDRVAANLAIETSLREAMPTFAGLYLKPDPAGGNPPKQVLYFLLRDNATESTEIPASLASDGALLITAFLALAYGRTPDIILIEEPENGLHPFLLRQVVDWLRKISTGEIGGRQRQVILTTHSPILLNFVEPSEVRIFSRHPEHGTTVTAMAAVPNVDNLLKEFAAGELWYLLGEEALVAGRQP